MMTNNFLIATLLVAAAATTVLATATTTTAQDPCAHLTVHKDCLTLPTCIEYNGKCVYYSPGLTHQLQTAPADFCGAISDSNRCIGSRTSPSFSPCFWFRERCRPVCSAVGWTGLKTPFQRYKTTNETACRATRYCTYVEKEYAGAEWHAATRCTFKCSAAGKDLAACELIAARERNTLNTFCSFDYQEHECMRECRFFQSNTSCDSKSDGRCRWITDEKSSSSSFSPSSASSYSRKQRGCVEKCERAQSSDSCFEIRGCMWVDVSSASSTFNSNKKIKKKFSTGCYTSCELLPADDGEQSCGGYNPACGVTTGKTCAVKHCDLLTVDECELNQQTRCMVVEQWHSDIQSGTNKKCTDRCFQYSSFVSPVEANNKSSSSSKNKTIPGCTALNLHGQSLCVEQGNQCVNTPNCDSLSGFGSDICSEFGCVPTNTNNAGGRGPPRTVCKPSCAKYLHSKEACTDAGHCDWAQDPNTLGYGCYVKCNLLQGADWSMKPLCVAQGARCEWLRSEHKCDYTIHADSTSSSSSSSSSSSQSSISSSLLDYPCRSFSHNSSMCIAPVNKGRCDFLNTTAHLVGCRASCGDFASRVQCYRAFEFQVSGCSWDPATCSCQRRCDAAALAGAAASDASSCAAASGGAMCKYNADFKICGYEQTYTRTAECNRRPQVGRMVLALFLIGLVVVAAFYVKMRFCSSDEEAPSTFAALQQDDPDDNIVSGDASPQPSASANKNDDDDDDGDHHHHHYHGGAAARREAAALPEPVDDDDGDHHRHHYHGGAAARRHAAPLPEPEWSPEQHQLEEKGGGATIFASEPSASPKTNVEDIFGGVDQKKPLPAAWKSDSERMQQHEQKRDGGGKDEFDDFWKRNK